MGRIENQRMKILYVLKVLWEETDEKHLLSAGQIAQRVSSYGISCERKSVYRDMDELAEFGYDIIRTRKGACLASRQFELPELKLLVDAVQASRFITDKKSSELITKLSMLVSQFEGKKLKRQILVKNRVKSMNESIYYNVDAIYDAMERDKEITFCYYAWNVRKELEPKRDGMLYQISPWFLQWEGEKYYMVGFDETADKMKHFRVDKMQNIQIGKIPRKGRKTFQNMDLETYGQQLFKMFQGKKETVTFLAENELAGVIIDRFGKEVWMHPEDGQHFKVTAEVMVSNQFFGWVTGLGGKLEIVGPEWVKEEYKRLLYDILKKKDT